eukprot:m.30974 g.30974  ORF g.30974 m.30974 type:complete len:241 (+) comp6871_c0_seq2:328-1050(+)
MSEGIQGFLMRADTVCRVVVSVCCLIVFADLAANGYREIKFSSINDKFSVYNCQDQPLDYTFAVALFGWLMATFFLCLFFADEVSSSVQAYRSQLVAIDLGFNGLWCFLFFIAFCWTTNMWTAGDATCFQIAGADAKFKKMKDCSDGYPKDVCFTDGNINAAGTGIAFSFFCTLLFGALCFFSAQKMSRGDSANVSYDQEYLGAADPDISGGVDDYEPSSVAYAPMDDSYTAAEPYNYVD